MSSFMDKVILVTGASSGIGEGTALHFASLGSRVVINARNLEKLNKVAQKCEEAGLGKEKILIAQGDVTKEEDAHGIVDKAIDTFGQLDILINNAGIISMAGFQGTSVEDYDRIMNLNIRGVVMVTQRAIPHLLKSKGNIVNVSSLLSQRPVAATVYYCMAKAALDMLTACLSQELGSKGVRVNSVNPGAIRTPALLNTGATQEQDDKWWNMQKWLHPVGRCGEVEEVAKAIAFLASDDAAFINGTHLTIDGGRNHVTPSFATGPIL